MSGYTVKDLKNLQVVIPVGTTVDQDDEWVPLFSWSGLPEGPTDFEVEIAGELGSTRPTNIQTRWRRPGDDTTKRKSHSIGTIKAWADVTKYLERISPDDQPFVFEIWQKGGSLTIVKIVAKAFNPLAYIAERIM